MFRYITLVIFLLCCNTICVAQVGCYIPSLNKIYTSDKSGQEWNKEPSVNVTGSVCPLNGSTSPCFVKLQGNNTQYGQSGNWDPVYCSIDRYIWVLICCTFILGLVYIRKEPT